MGNIWVLAEALAYAVDPDGNPNTNDGADVINLSLSTLRRTRLLRSVLSKICDDMPQPGEDNFPAVANPELVIVVAAGNGGDTTPQYPAAENVAGMLAVAASTSQDTLANFSTRGSWIGVASPGQEILSTVPGGQYATWNGTSMAAPIVAGEAALVHARFAGLSGRKIVDHIARTSARITGAVSARIDAGAALTSTPEPETSLQFEAGSYNVSEGAGSVTVTVTRTGNVVGTSSVEVKTADTDTFSVGCSDTNNNQGGAFSRCDFATSIEKLTFAPGDLSETFTVPIVNDQIFERNETFKVVLVNPSSATLASTDNTQITIIDDDVATAGNPIFATPFFVRQHYLDFLSREPEQGEPWSALLNGCPDVNSDPACDRVTVSAAFFGSVEFQLKGYYVYRFFKLAFNRLPTYTEISNDMRSVTGQTPSEVFQKKAAFANGFVARVEFLERYSGISNAEFVSRLMDRYALDLITTVDPAAPDGTNNVTFTRVALINGLNEKTLNRVQVLRAIADSNEVIGREFNQAFVAMQYYGYLRRTPEAAGFNAWVAYLDSHPNDLRTMVNGFMNSSEYRLRFGAATP